MIKIHFKPVSLVMTAVLTLSLFTGFSFNTYTVEAASGDTSVTSLSTKDKDKDKPKVDKKGTTEEPSMVTLDSDMVNVKDYGALGDGITDDTAAITAAFGNASEKTVYIPDGTYCISSTLTVPANVSLLMSPSAVLKATAAMDTLLDTDLSVRRINRDIRGGTLDCNQLAAKGLYLRYFWGGYLENIFIKNPTQIFMKIGDSAAQTSQIENGEISIMNIRGERDRQLDVPTGSIGVLFENVYDSMISNCTITGAEVGFRVSANASMVMSQCHVWNYISGHPNFGGLKIAFDLLGAGCQLFECYADTVTQTGYNISSKGLVSLVDCKTYTNNVGPDNVATAVYVAPKEGSWCYNNIINMKINGANSTHRILKDYDGDLSLTTIFNSTRINVSNITQDQIRNTMNFLNAPTFVSGIDIMNDSDLTKRKVNYKFGGKNRFTLGLDGGVETGGNTGSGFSIFRFEDDGVTKQQVLWIDRKTGRVEFGDLTALSLKGTYSKPITLNKAYYYWIDDAGELRFKKADTAPASATDGDLVSGAHKVTTLPTADATQRGRIIRIEGGTGVADSVYICVKLANDTYQWVNLIQ